jgi:hypothetical protein
VNHIPTAIEVNPVTGYKGDLVNLIATLTDTHNNIPIPGKTVQFSVDGTVVGSAVTNALGVATLPYTFTQNAGIYTILAEFAQDAAYAASSNTNTLTVNHIPTAIVVNPVTGYKGDLVNLIATLTDTHNNIPIPGKTVQFSVNGTVVGSAVTNALGVATRPYTITQNFGVYTILARFVQDSVYAASTDTSTLTVLDATPPVVTAIDPVNNAVNVSLNKVIRITFSEPILAGTTYNNITVRNVNTGTLVNIAKSISGSVLTITRTGSSYPSGNMFLVTLPVNSIANMNNTGLNPAFTTSFSIKSVNPLRVISTNPVNGAVNVPVNKVITINFNLPIQAGTTYNSTTVKNITTGNLAIIGRSISGSVLNITHAAPFTRANRYIITLPVNSVADMNRTGLNPAQTSSFTVSTV